MYMPQSRNAQAIEIVKNIPGNVKDEVYRLIWHEHVKKDVLQLIEDDRIDIDTTGLDLDDFADHIAGLYVYEGDYDCNQAYWDNIANLINEQDLNDFKHETEKPRYSENLAASANFIKENYRKNQIVEEDREEEER